MTSLNRSITSLLNVFVTWSMECLLVDGPTYMMLPFSLTEEIDTFQRDVTGVEIKLWCDNRVFAFTRFSSIPDQTLFQSGVFPTCTDQWGPAKIVILFELKSPHTSWPLKQTQQIQVRMWVLFSSFFMFLQLLPIRFTQQSLCCSSKSTMRHLQKPDWKPPLI